MINCMDGRKSENIGNNIIVGVGEMAVSGDAGTIIKTYGLGSCVAIIALDPITGIIGMVHVALPDSNIDRGIAKERPGYFANTGIPALIDMMHDYGSIINTGKMIVKIAGGAQTLDENNVFEIGNRNVTAIKRILWMNNMSPVSADTGGRLSRTVSAYVSSGTVKIYDSSGNCREL